jgi:hypothetical protein
MLLRVPHERRDAIALVDPESAQGPGKAIGALGDLRIAGPVDLSGVPKGRHLGGGIDRPHPPQHAPNAQLVVVLHQTLEHWSLLVPRQGATGPPHPGRAI